MIIMMILIIYIEVIIFNKVYYKPMEQRTMKLE